MSIIKVMHLLSCLTLGFSLYDYNFYSLWLQYYSILITFCPVIIKTLNANPDMIARP